MLRRLAVQAHSLLAEQHVAQSHLPAASTVWQSCRGLKGSTGIVGIEVDPEARNTFTEKCKAVIDLVGLHIPAEAAYRRTVESTYRHRLKTSESGMADEEVEETFSAQLEQLSKMADEELALIPKMGGARSKHTCMLQRWGIPSCDQTKTLTEVLSHAQNGSPGMCQRDTRYAEGRHSL